MTTVKDAMADLIFSLDQTLNIAKRLSTLLPNDGREAKNGIAIYPSTLSVRKMLVLIARSNNNLLEVKRAISPVMFSKHYPDRNLASANIYSTLHYAKYQFQWVAPGQYKLLEGRKTKCQSKI